MCLKYQFQYTNLDALFYKRLQASWVGIDFIWIWFESCATNDKLARAHGINERGTKEKRKHKIDYNSAWREIVKIAQFKANKQDEMDMKLEE